MLKIMSRSWMVWTAVVMVALAAVAGIVLNQRAAHSDATMPVTVIAGSASTYNMLPVTTSQSAPPLVMLVMSRDEALFNKGYSDYSDINGDGVLDTTYDNTITYIGYFDPTLCYSYASSQYAVSGAATTDSNNNSTHGCGGNGWSGNFMNWVAMSRLDLLRYTLYGGNRSTDSTTATVLERAYIPDDTHSWSKVYTAADLNNYVPTSIIPDGSSASFCNTTLTSSNSISDGQPPIIRIATGVFTEWAATEGQQCQWRGSDTSYAAANKPTQTNTTTTGTTCATNATCTYTQYAYTQYSYTQYSWLTYTQYSYQQYTQYGFKQGTGASYQSYSQATYKAKSTCATTTAPSCPATSLRCSTNTTCTTATVNIGATSTCPSGYTCSNQVATTCPSLSSGSCGTATVYVGSTSTCPTGYTCTNQTDDTCPALSTGSCSSTVIKIGANSTCPSGYTCSTQVAGSCPTLSTGSCGTSTQSATSCPSGYTCSTVQTAAACPSGYNCSSTVLNAGSCPAGYTCTTSNITGQASCPGGYSCTSTITNTSTCPSGFTCTSVTFGGVGDYTARIKVCDSTAAAMESFCKTYTDTGGVAHYKPTGLLQKFGESGQIRFGLMTGNYATPRTGGILRRNIGLMAGNVSGSQCATATSGDNVGSMDEINTANGTFCSNNSEGIIQTLAVMHQPGWGGSNYNVNSDCSIYGILNRDGVSGANGNLKDPGASGSNSYACAGWGNPLAEIYAEAVRYIEGNGKTPTSTYNTNDQSYFSSTVGNSLYLPLASTWRDPYSQKNWCAKCSIIVISTGQDSFDTDELPSSTALGGIDPIASTNTVGTNEGVDGSTSYIIGRVTALDKTTYSDLCSAQVVPALSQAIGICPEVPAREGGYDISGLAWKAWTTDLRPDLTNALDSQGSAHQFGQFHRVQTYAIALADSLPTYSIPLASGAVNLSPLCQSNNAGQGSTIRDSNNRATATINGWRSCGFLSLTVGPRQSTVSPYYVYGRPVVYDANDNQVEGSFGIVWEDSQWGNDHDLDGSSMISFCVGATACAKTTNGQTGTGANGAHGICWNAPNTGTGSVCDGNGNVSSSFSVTNNTVLVRVEALSAVAGNSLLFGFSTSGAATSTDTQTASTTTVNGAHRVFVRPGGCSSSNGQSTDDSLITSHASHPSTGTGCDWSPPQVFAFTGSSTLSAQNLQNPLFYAAKYGGFNYTTDASTGLPTTTNPLPSKPSDSNHSDWDSINNTTGVAGTDGLPDNYFPVRNPTQLANQLGLVLNNILKQAGSGTAAAVVANEREGDGATYQALYVPSKTDGSNTTATWLGTLQALFVDSYGNLREANPSSPGVLADNDFSSATGNPAVSLVYNTNTNQTEIHRYNCNPSTSTSCAYTVDNTLDDLKPIWSARDQLAALTGSTNKTGSNRAYNATADNGRYIFTFLDKNLDGTVNPATEQVPFDISSFKSSAGNYYGILNVVDSDGTGAATSLISYIRGTDLSGYRNRTVDYYASGTSLTYPLGDIVNSTPTVVGVPAEAYDLLYNDRSYTVFRASYQARRQMVYVGANDGMLHAFNGGFYNASTNTFQLQGNNNEAKHPLGSEVWAYVPFNLLPHLPWLTAPNYGHVFYFDGTPRTMDVRIFNNDGNCTPATTQDVSPGSSQTCHPYGWGTILIVGMRFGGGDLSLPAGNPTYSPEFSAFSNLSGTGATITTHSAYAVLDITNPEQPPVLLAEITGATPLAGGSYGFTTVNPAGIAMSALNNTVTSPGAGNTDHWYFVFGNGPDSIATGGTASNAKLVVYPLVLGSMSSTSGVAKDTGVAQSVMGDPITVDWNLDFLADNLYFGISNGSNATPGGKLFKETVSASQPASPSQWTAPTVLTDPGLPILEAPSAALDTGGNKWIYAGSGRLFVPADKSSVEQQTLFGVIDGTTLPTYGNLTDVSSGRVKVTPDSSGNNITGITGATTESALESKVLSNHGWKTLLRVPAATDTASGSERVLTASAVLGGTLFATAYTPNNSLCLGNGNSRLFGVNFITGLANPVTPALGVNSTDTTVYNNFIDLGAGLAAAPSLHVNNTTSNNGSVTVITQTSTGSIVTTGAQVSPSLNNAEVDWRQTHPGSGP